MSDTLTVQPLPDPGAAPPAAGGAPARPANLGQQTVSGFAWLTLQTIASKLISTAAQIVLARLLLKEDFGLAALVLTASVLGLIQQPVFREVLIQRQAEFGKWVAPAYWLSVAQGVVGGLVLVALSPLAARVYGEPRLVPMLSIFAAATLLTGVAGIYSAALATQMQFRRVSGIVFVSQTLLVLLTIAFAACGFGAYSFVLPRPIVAAYELFAYRRASHLSIPIEPHFNLWGGLLRAGGLLTATTFFNNLLSIGDYLVLGLFHPAAVVGVYFFAFNLSTQTIQLLTGSLSGVLFPALGKLAADPRQQTRALVRATALLTLVGVPTCFLQAAVAAPAVHLLFGPKWRDAVPVLQTLSVGTAFVLIGGPAISLMKAQGRFGLYFKWTVICAAAFLTSVLAGAASGAALSVATAVAAFYLVFGALGFYISIRPTGGTWSDVAKVLCIPVACGGLAAAFPVALTHWTAGLWTDAAVARLAPAMSRFPWLADLAAAAAAAAWVLVIYSALVTRFAPDDTADLANRLRLLTARFRKQKDA